MGYKVQRKIYCLKFQGTEWDGLEVNARSLNTGQLLDLESARLARTAGGEGSDGATDRMMRLFADALVSWNAEDEDTDEPIPATLAGVLAQDIDFNMAIINAWQEAIAGVPSPLPQTSNDGEPSLEASIPMDVPSESLAS